MALCCLMCVKSFYMLIYCYRWLCGMNYLRRFYQGSSNLRRQHISAVVILFRTAYPRRQLQVSWHFLLAPVSANGPSVDTPKWLRYILYHSIHATLSLSIFEMKNRYFQLTIVCCCCCCLSASSDDSIGRLLRRRRALVYPDPGGSETKVQVGCWVYLDKYDWCDGKWLMDVEYKVLFGLGLPMEGEVSMTLGYVVKCNYDLPYNWSQVTGESEIHRDRRSAGGIYSE